MINELKNITEYELSRIKNKNITVYEKIDAPYFTIEIDTEGNTFVKKSNGTKIDEVDWTLNEINKKVVQFATNIKYKLTYNSTHIIGIFYFPCDKPRTIEYPGMGEKFLISYIKEIDEKTKEVSNITDLKQYISHNKIDAECLCPVLNAIIDDEIETAISKYRNEVYSGIMLCTKLFGKSVNPSKLLKSEGYIFNIGNKKFKVILNDRKQLDDMCVKKLSRDMVLKDFTYWYLNNTHIVKRNRTYINEVSNLFVDYIKDTDIVKKYDIEEDELEPPYIGYKGNIVYDFITNNETIDIISTDKIALCIFKILLSALKTGIRKKHDDILTDDIVEKFNNISKEIKERIL